jgi:hypothetical protein
MKFILSLFALVVFFAFALADAAKGLTYSNYEQTIVGTEPAQDINLNVAQTPREEKAGLLL